MLPILDRTKENNINYQGCLMEITHYKNNSDIIVEFKDKHNYKTRTTYQSFKKGQVKNKFFPSMYGVGYIGNTDTTINKKEKQSYKKWRDMIQRCYSGDSKYYNSYQDCSVCEDWLCYSNFEKWFDENYWEVEDDIMCLDKDILTIGNRIYSPNKCIIVPNKINLLLIGAHKKAKGFVKCSGCNTYNSSVSILGEYINLGNFKTKEDAFKAYKNAKEYYIKNVADRYKNKYPNFPQKLYDAMCNYQIKITD